MKFRYEVLDTWESTTLGVCHLIGRMVEGVVAADTVAVVEGPFQGEVVIKSIPIITFRDPRAHRHDVTLNIEKPAFDLVSLKGCILRSKD